MSSMRASGRKMKSPQDELLKLPNVPKTKSMAAVVSIAIFNWRISPGAESYALVSCGK
jgi:hypothetical protein